MESFHAATFTGALSNGQPGPGIDLSTHSHPSAEVLAKNPPTRTSSLIPMPAFPRTASALALGLATFLAGTFSADAPADPALRQELLDRRDRDQTIRNELIASGAEHPDPQLAERMRRIDGENTARMKEIVKQHGWPGPELIGEDGTRAAWLLVQHSTPEFQKEMLPLVKAAYEAGKLAGSNYALLQDRVLVHEGKPQIYGSQGRWENGVLGLQPIEDEANVDARRAQVGLRPLAEYLRGPKETYRSKDAKGVPAPRARPGPVRRPLPSEPLARLKEIEQRAADARAAFASAAEQDQAKLRNEASSALQLLAWARSFVGDHAGALEAFRDSGRLTSSRFTPPPLDPEKVESALKGTEPVDAIGAIVEAARDRQIVILNEAHHVPRHRAFALQLARALRQAGFQYLACEAFSSDLDADALRQRGFTTTRDGFYLSDPLFADFIRESLRLGFIPVPYEYRRPSGPPATSAADSIMEREEGQASNLMDRIFRKDPTARVFIYVGFAHLMKREQRRGSEPDRTVQWMAGRLKAMSGLDPLTIDQVAMTDPEAGSLAAAVVERVFAGLPERSAAQVLRRQDGTGFHVSGSYAGDTDLQVLHRPTRTVDGRPDWLGMSGYRSPQSIPAEVLPTTGRRLVQAFAEGETDSAIAVDQVLVTAGAEPTPKFYLPAGKFRYRFEE